MILPVTSAEHIAQVRQLFLEYAAALDFKLCFQNFQKELDELPGSYAPPGGGLWLALEAGGQPVGCVALRPLSPGVAEMKRLYVRPEQRHTGLGKRLAQNVVAAARARGYRALRLDTTPAMQAAVRLYERLGFVRIAPYYDNPIEGAIYMERTLDGNDSHHVIQVTATQVDLVAPLFDLYRQFYGQPADADGARRFLTERLQRGEAVIFAVVERGGALGFTQLYPSFSSVSMGPIWILNDLFVLPAARRRGVGERLLRAARDHARHTGALRLALSTAVSNLTAQALYERDGWHKDTAFLHYEYELGRS